MILEYIIIVVVTIGIILGIIFGKYQLVKRTKVKIETSPSLKTTDDKINDFLIRETKERINQELQNVSADELKANVVAATSVVFAILVISEFLRIYKQIDVDLIWVPTILVGLTSVILFVGFLNGLKVLIPRKNRYNLWLPRDTNNSYAEKKVSKEEAITAEFKKELIENFETIIKSRDRDRLCLMWGYGLLIGGSLISFITLISTHIFWLNG